MNLYQIVGVPPGASSAEIEKKIREEYRKNQRRVNNPDQAKRQAAERRAEQLMEARRILLDPAQRQAYDVRLPTESAAQPVVETNDWLTEARGRLSINDYFGALYAAREARRAMGDNVAEIWGIMAQANLGQGNGQEALFEAQRAVNLDQNNAEFRNYLGLSHEELGQWDAAIQQFEVSRQLDPAAEFVTVEIANCLAKSGRTPSALQQLEHLYATTANRQFVGDALGFFLVQAAEAVPQAQTGEEYVVTSDQEIRSMRQYLMRAHQVATDPELHQEIQRAEAYLRQCESKHFHPPDWLPAGCAIPALIAAVIIIVICTCAVGGAFSTGSNDGASTAASGVACVFGVTALAGLIVGAIFLCFEPRWKQNRRAWQQDQRRRY